VPGYQTSWKAILGYINVHTHAQTLK